MASVKMLVEQATDAIDNLGSLADGESDSMADICVAGKDVIHEYQELARDARSVLSAVRNELNYALEVFYENCQCGKCSPCERQKKMKSVLKREKKMWNRLKEAF